MYSNLKNVGWMFLMQIMVYPIQLLLIPILSGVLGSEGYGEYIYGISVIGLTIPLIDFGTTIHFQSIINKLTHHEKEILISNTLGLKTILFAISIFFIFAFIFFSEIKNLSIFLLIGWPVFSIISMDFVYLAELKNQELFKRQFIQKIVFFVTVLPLIQIFNSVNFLFICLSLSYIPSALITLRDLKKFGFNVNWKCQRNFIKNTLKSNILYFINNFTNIGFSSINILFIKNFFGLNYVASFSILESLSRACISLVTSINSVVYPLMSKEINKQYLKKGIWVVISLYTPICLFLYLFRGNLYTFFKLPIIDDSIIIVMLAVLLLDATSRFLEYNFLGAIGKGNIANTSNLIGLISYIPIWQLLLQIMENSLLLFALTYLCSLFIVLSIRMYYNYKLVLK